MQQGPFRGFRIHRDEAGVRGRVEQLTLDQLSPGEVVVQVHYSAINYKDALAATGAGAILRRYPLVGGIDLAGHVVESAEPRIEVGDKVLVCGC